MNCFAISSGGRTKSQAPRIATHCHSSSTTTQKAIRPRRPTIVLGRRRVAVPAGHEEIHRQLGTEISLASDLERALAYHRELVAHAAVVVVVGDLLRTGAAADSAGAELAELGDVLQADKTLAQRVHQLPLVVDLELLAQIDDDDLGPARAFVVELALRIEPGGGLDADDMRARREPLAEQDRIAGVRCRE